MVGHLLTGHREGAGTQLTLRPDAARTPARRTARRWALFLLAGWLCQVALRVWLSRMQVMPLANPDESAYLIAARVLAGGAPGNFSGGTLYRVGYPALITPVYWFTSDPTTVYRAVMVINALISAALMPLAYLACRRLRLSRGMSYGIAAVAALLPVAVFYSEYALTDAIFPVMFLGWLLTVHSWLTSSGRRGQYGAAAGSAALAGYSYAVHARGDVILAVHGALLILVAVRRLAPRKTLIGSGTGLLVTLLPSVLLDHTISAANYPSGARSLLGELVSRALSVQGEAQVLGMACGQLWRLSVDTWGIGGIGLVAVVAAMTRRSRRVRRDLRVMAALLMAVTVAIAYGAPAALPSNQTADWASGRYLDCVTVVFFLVGMVVLLRGGRSLVLRYGAGAAALAVATGFIVFGYAGPRFGTQGFLAFNFGTPAVLTQSWTHVNVLAVTAVALGLLAFWVALALAVRALVFRARRGTVAGCAALLALTGVMNLFAVQQMTTHISQAAVPVAREDAVEFVTGSGLKPGEHVAIDTDLGSAWWIWVPQAYEVWWTQLQSFDPATSPPPPGVSVVEMAWPAGKPASASWPSAPSGWHIVISNSTYGWVAWRYSPASTGR